MREMMLSNSRTPLQISTFLFGRVQSSSGYIHNLILYIYI